MRVLTCCRVWVHKRGRMLARVKRYVSSMPRTGAIFSAACGSTTFFDIILQTTRFSEKVIENKLCVLIFSTKFI